MKFGFDREPNDTHFRELEILKKLEHENVIQLFAFHDQCCPEMYITEDYSENLQAVLVNRSCAGAFTFPTKRLEHSVKFEISRT
jgi:hypothetical protein